MRQLIQSRKEFPLLYLSPVVSHTDNSEMYCDIPYALSALTDGMIPVSLHVFCVEHLFCSTSISILHVPDDLPAPFILICSTSLPLFVSHHSFYSPVILPLLMSSYLSFLTALFFSVSPVYFLCLSVLQATLDQWELVSL